MLRNTIMLAAVAGLVLAVSPVAVADYATGFEPGEDPPDYTGSPLGEPLIEVFPDGQGGWHDPTSWKKTFNVHTYLDNEVTYFKASIGEVVTYNIPPNPNGGEQFLADDETIQVAGTAINNVHDVFYSGIMELSVDYFPGEELGGDWNSALLARDPGNNAGFYTGRASSAEENPGPGPWAPQFQVWDLAGAKINNFGQGYRFEEVPGFDNLEMEQWYRIGVVVNWDTREILEIKSQKLVLGEAAVSVLAPKGPADEDLYVSMTAPGDIQHIRLFDGGANTLTGFDNVYVGDPYEWKVVGPDVVPGDVDGDDDVDLADLGFLEAQFGMSGLPVPPVDPNSADIDEDGDVDLDDWKIMRDYWGAVAEAPAGGVIPEPATMTLLAIGGLMVLRRRRS